MSTHALYHDENSLPKTEGTASLKQSLSQSKKSSKPTKASATRRVLGTINPASTNANRQSAEGDKSNKHDIKKHVRSASVPSVEQATPHVHSRLSQLTLSPKFDAKDAEDPQCAVEYVKDIYEYYKKTEKKHSPNPSYMKKQTDLTSKMRAVLVDWLITVHHQFRLKPETIYLTVNIIDRFLSLKLISRNKLQLVGVTALMLGSKYEDIYSPEVQDFVWVTDKSYTKDEILRMERVMLASLNFSLTVPTVFPFMKRFLRVSYSDRSTEYLAQFFAETSLLDTRMLKCLPSKVGAVAVFLARLHTLGDKQQAWTAEVEHYSGYTLEDVETVAKAFYSFVKNVERSKLQAVCNKYSSEKRGAVTKLVTDRELTF